MVETAGEKYVDPMSRQLSPDGAGYDPYGATGGSGCASCRWFLSPDRCLIVGGSISPTGKSDWYAALPDSESMDMGMAELPETETFISKLLRFVGMKGEKQEAAPSDTTPAFSLKELPDGRMRFFTLATNNYVDRIGEVFPADAHREFIDWAEKEGGYPELWPFHAYGGRLGVVDWMDFDGNFLLSSGLIDQGMEAKAKAWADDPETAMSHGFLKRQVGSDIVQYREFEQSVLPRWAAANPFTDFSLGVKEMAFTPQKRTALAEKGYTEEEIKGLEGYTEQFRTKLAEAGVSFKDIEPAPDPEPAPTPDETPAPAGAPASGITLDDIRAVVREEMAASVKEVAELRASVKSFEEGADGYFAQLWQRKAGSPVAAGSKSATTVVPDDQRESAKPNSAGWINDVPIFQHPIFNMGAGGPR